LFFFFNSNYPSLPDATGSDINGPKASADDQLTTQQSSSVVFVHRDHKDIPLIDQSPVKSSLKVEVKQKEVPKEKPAQVKPNDLPKVSSIIF